MIQEVAHLTVKPGESTSFETTMEEAKHIIASQPGFIEMTVRKCLDEPDQYLLSVKWDTLEDHTIGFRTSPDYELWKTLLHHYYDPFPTVYHYGEPIIQG